MGLALGTAAVVFVVLLWELARPTLADALTRARRMWAERHRPSAISGYDPGRERRAEQRARELLRSCVSAEDWSMYSDLGLLRVWGGGGGRRQRQQQQQHQQPQQLRQDDRPAQQDSPAPYAYLIYPHKPIVAYVPETGELLNEYCVAFPDESRPYGSARLPDSDDVLAKWMALAGDERRLIGEANMHLPGRQVDPERVRRDLLRIARWERERSGETLASRTPAQSVDNVRAA